MPPLSAQRSSLSLALAGLAACTLLAYSPALRNGYVWDDSQYVAPLASLPASALPALLSSDLYAVDPSDAPSGYHRPVAVLSLWLTAHLGGPVAQHAGNLALHALTAALLLLLLVRRIGPPALGAALLAAALFAVHPEQAETVAWISCRYDLLTGAFAVALLLLPWKPGPARAGLHGLLFLAGLLSKEGFLAIAFVVLADDFAARRPVRAALPRWLAVAAAITSWLGLRAALQIGAIQPGPLADVPRTFLSAVSIYLGRAAWPLPLTVSHPFAPLGPTGLAIGAAAVVVLLGIGLRVRSLLPAVALVLAPVAAQSLAMSRLGIAPERYFYLPSIGLAWLLAAGLARLQPLLARPRLRAMLARPPLLLLSTAAALAALGVATVATVRRLPDWRSDEALFTAAAAIDPNDALANLYLGIAAGTSGHLEEAQQRLERAKAREPDNARIANALAWALLHRGDGEAAKAEARRAVALSPGLPQARLTLASAYHLTGAHLAERVEADRAVKLSPRFLEARVTRVLAFCEIDRAPACEADLDLIDREQPLLDDAFSRVVRVEAALRRGNLVSATERLEGLRAAHPGDARLAILTKARDALLRRPAGKK